jgi:hypothetical protein
MPSFPLATTGDNFKRQIAPFGAQRSFGFPKSLAIPPNNPGRTVALTGDFYAGVWHPRAGLYCIGLYLGGSAAYVSRDGLAWEAVAMPANQWAGACYAPELGRAVMASNAGITASCGSDARTWTAGSGTTGILVGVCWSAKRRLFVLTRYNSNVVYRSTNGVTWSASTLPFSTTWRWVQWVDALNLFVVISELGRTAYSQDGITWFSGTLLPSVTWRSMVWVPEWRQIVAVGSGSVAMSRDGKQWRVVNNSTGRTLISVDWLPSMQMLCANVTSGPGSLLFSRDGHRWIDRDSVITGGGIVIANEARREWLVTSALSVNQVIVI